MEKTVTTCPYCGVGCGLVAGVQDGRLTAVEGDALHPVNRGATCQKPLALPDAVHAPDRATVPLVRDGLDERWRSVGWSAAVRRVAGRMRGVIERHGPGAVAFYLSGQLLSEDYYVANKLGKGFIGTNNVDANSRLCMSSAVSGHQGAFGADGPPASYADLDRADCFVLLGANAAACHPIVWARIRRRQAEGAQVIVIDPRRTATAQAADLHLPVRPGGDLALLNAMLGVLAGEGLLDEPFLARRTEGATEALAVAAQWPPPRAQEACGVEAAAIEDAARRFGRAPRAMVLWSMGANQSTVGTLKNRALINLCLATGNLGRPGCGPLSLTGQPNAMGGREVGGLCAQLPGYRSVADPEHRAEMRRLWDIPSDAPGIAPEPGLAATEMADALHDGRVRALWVCGSNPVASQPDPERFVAGLRAADLVVVADAHFPTETSALAHVALPAAAWPEKEGTMTNSERRVSFVRRALDPPGQALPDWEMLARVGRALGHRGAFAWRTSAAVYAEFVATTAGRPCDMTGLSHERLRREGPRQWPCPARRSGREGHPGTERLYASGPCPTPTGRARLAPTPHAEPLDAPDGDHPLVLATGRVASQWHTMTRTGHSATLREQEPEPFVELHPRDAQRAEVSDGARVRLVSRRGHTHLRARVTDGVPAGVAFAPFHWGAAHLPPGDAPLNELVGVALDPVSKQAELKATAVRVESAAGSGPEARVTEGARGARLRPVPQRVLVVGGGMAGLEVADALGAHGPGRFATTLAGTEKHLPYDRVRLSAALSGEVSNRGLTLRPKDWFAAREIDVRTGAHVAALDAAQGRATLADGEELTFDRVVLATGSVSALPPIGGLQRRGVHAFRSVDDVVAITQAASSARRAVVVGGGLLGLEAARGLRARGLEVSVVHLADRLMEQQLDGLAAGLLARRLGELGVEVLLEAMTTEVAGNGRAEGVRLADGRERDADLVVVATGIRPDVELARAAGLEIDRGVVVDDTLRASRPGTWAVGECAQHRGTVYGLWAPVRRQAQTAAAVLAGRSVAFHGAVPATTLKVAGVDLFCAGRPEAGEGQEEVLSLDTRRGRYRKLVLDGGRVVGAILLGDLRDAGRLRGLVEHGRPAPVDLLDGAFAAPAAPAEKDAAQETLCTCHGVSRGSIERAVRQGGLERVEQVARATGATTSCGGCRPSVEALLAARPAETPRDALAARAGG